MHVGAVSGVEPGDLPGAGVDRDQLIPPTAGFLPITGPLGVLGVQQLTVPGDDPKSGVFSVHSDRSSRPVMSATQV